MHNTLTYSPPSDTVLQEYTESELHEGVNLWKFSLLGVIVGQPLYNAMIQYVKKYWHVIPVVSLTAKGVFVFRFGNQKDVDTIVDVGHWTINGMYPLLLRQWQLGTKLDVKSLQSLPIWIKVTRIGFEILD